MSNDYLPKKDKDLLAMVVNLLKNLFAMLTRIGFPNDEYQKLAALRNDFAEKLAIAEDPATSTKVTVAAKNHTREVLKSTLRLNVKGYIMYNPLVTDEDRIAMGLPVHKTTHTPSKVADKAPDVDIDSSVPGRITIHFFDAEGGHRRGKLAGQHCVEITWLVSDVPPTRWDELIHSVVDTRSPYTFIFENDMRGRHFYFAIRWENTRGEKGPWSEIMSAIIP
jgi:hypothetical protein